MRLAFALAVLVSPVLLGSCSDEAPASTPASQAVAAGPGVVAERFLEAVMTSDEAAFTDLLTTGARGAMADGEGFQLDGASLESFRMGAVTEKGDEAEVAVHVTENGQDQTNDVLLRREDGAWRVYGMRVAFGEGSFTVDFEGTTELLAEFGNELAEEFGRQMEAAFADAQKAWEQGGTDEEIAARHASFEALEAVTEAEHEAAWRVDLELADRPLRAALTELLDGTGVAFDAEGLAAFDEAVTVNLAGVSRVEAIERLAALAGTHPVWPDAQVDAWGENPEPEPIRFAAGPRPLPAAFAGPFLVEVTDLREDAPNTVGGLSFAVRALGLAPAALAMQDEMEEYVHLERLHAADGTALTDLDVHYMSTPTVRDGYFVQAVDRPLSGLLRGVEEIPVVAGELRFPLPTAIEEVAFERGETTKRTARGTVSVKSWGEQTTFSLEGEGEDLQDLQVRMGPTKASGDPLGVRFSSSMGWGANLTADVQCPEAPAAVALKICTVQTVVEPFELGPVPLARFADQPVRLEPLSFPGDAPLAIEVLSSKPRDDGDRDVTVRIVNRSNKDAVSAWIDFEYLDASGAVLKDFPHTLTGDFDFDAGAIGPVAPAGATLEKEAWAAFVPEGTASVRARLRSVEFPDATTWEVEQR